ncbi:MAG: hypothetical protein ACR2RA_22345, partial [Geminicoccaceae bacterium]
DLINPIPLTIPKTRRCHIISLSIPFLIIGVIIKYNGKRQQNLGPKKSDRSIEIDRDANVSKRVERAPQS